MNAFHRAELAKLGMPPEDEIRDAFFSNRFDAAYVPVVSADSGKVLGFQALERCRSRSHRRPGAGQFPDRHRSLLSPRDRLELKRQQIIQAPHHGWLMLDLDPASFFASDTEQPNALLHLFERYAWSEREIIVNLTGRHEIAGLQVMADRLQRSGVEIALDAVGLHRGLFSLATFLDATVVKFDRSTLRSEGPTSIPAETLLRVAHDIGVQTVMTGVDRPEHYEWARRLGVDGVQGRLFRSDGMRHQ